MFDRVAEGWSFVPTRGRQERRCGIHMWERSVDVVA